MKPQSTPELGGIGGTGNRWDTPRLVMQSVRQIVDRLDIRRIKRSLNLSLDRIGWPGVAGVTLLAFCLAFYVSAIAPTETELERLKQEVIAKQQNLRHSQQSTRAGMNSPAGQLATFYDAFPRPKTAPDWIETIYLAAQEQNLKLEQGEYRTAREQVGPLTRYQITLPVKGPYLQIRKFVAAVLSQVPTASLDSIKFERQKIADGTIEARIKLTLYLGDGR